MRKYPIIPEYLDKSIADTNIFLMDILHDYLKNEIFLLQDLETTDRYLQGYATCLENIYTLCYSLMFARLDVLNEA